MDPVAPASMVELPAAGHPSWYGVRCVSVNTFTAKNLAVRLVSGLPVFLVRNHSFSLQKFERVDLVSPSDRAWIVAVTPVKHQDRSAWDKNSPATVVHRSAGRAPTRPVSHFRGEAARREGDIHQQIMRCPAIRTRAHQNIIPLPSRRLLKIRVRLAFDGCHHSMFLPRLRR